jgi:hypothetical protein
MTRLRLWLVGISAIFAAFCFAAGSASALSLSPCVHEPAGTHIALCVEEPGQSPATLLLFSTNTTFEGAKEAGTSWYLNAPAFSIDWSCEEVRSTGTFEPEGVSAGLTASKVVFTIDGNCEDSSDPTECEVKEPITTRQLSATLSLLSNGSLDVLFKPTTGTLFTEITIKSKLGETCGSALERAKVDGLDLCEGVGTESEADKTFQLLRCSTSGSELTFGGDAAEYELTEELHLNEPAVKEWLWDIISGT